MHRGGTTCRRQRSRSWSRDRDRRDVMDRGRREDDRTRDYHEDRRRSDARDRVLDCGQRDYRDSELDLHTCSRAAAQYKRVHYVAYSRIPRGR